MKRDLEVYDDPKAFLAAQKRQPRSPRQRPRDARPDTPRAEMGHGDHLAALMRLSAAGWCFYQCQHGQHYFSRLDGTLGPIGATYKEAIDATEAIAARTRDDAALDAADGQRERGGR